MKNKICTHCAQTHKMHLLDFILCGNFLNDSTSYIVNRCLTSYHHGIFKTNVVILNHESLPKYMHFDIHSIIKYRIISNILSHDNCFCLHFNLYFIFLVIILTYD